MQKDEDLKSKGLEKSATVKCVLKQILLRECYSLRDRESLTLQSKFLPWIWARRKTLSYCLSPRAQPRKYGGKGIWVPWPPGFRPLELFARPSKEYQWPRVVAIVRRTSLTLLEERHLLHLLTAPEKKIWPSSLGFIVSWFHHPNVRK